MIFQLKDGKHLYQWDKERVLEVIDESINEVHFASDALKSAIARDVYEDEGKRFVKIPSILLQYACVLTAYAYKVEDREREYTLLHEEFKVLPRKQPDVYIPEDESYRWSTLRDEVVAAKEAAIGAANDAQEAKNAAEKAQQDAADIVESVSGAVDEALGAADSAAENARKAESAATIAAESEDKIADAVTTATNKAAEAWNSATAAGKSATDAGKSAEAAATSELATKKHAENAASSAGKSEVAKEGAEAAAAKAEATEGNVEMAYWEMLTMRDNMDAAVNNAINAANTASAKATEAGDSATAAETARDEASASATAAAESEKKALQYANDTAQTYADVKRKHEDIRNFHNNVVDATQNMDYYMNSASRYASKAQTAQNAAAKSETNAAASASAAEQAKVDAEAARDEAVAAKDGIAIPAFWKAHIDSKAATIKSILDASGVDAFMAMWAADIHGSTGYPNNNGQGTSSQLNVGTVAEYTCDKYNIPYVLLAGDIMSQGSHADVNGVYAEYDALGEILKPINPERLLMAKGNHDGAWGAPVDGVYYLKNIGANTLYNYLFRRQALDRNRVWGGDGTYCYVDDAAQHVRVIMLNGHTTADGSVDANGNAVYNCMKHGVYGTEQLKWLSETALDVPEGTRIVVFAHQPFTVSKDGTLLAGLLDAYNKRTIYSSTKNVKDTYWGKEVTDETYTKVTVSGDFANAKGKVVLYLHGHIHYDSIDTTTYTFVVASITTAGGDVRDEYIVKRVPGTATETAMDVVIVSKKSINFVRIGAGNDRVIALDDTVYYSITNNLTNTTTNNSAGTIAADGSYKATLTANGGYTIKTVTITMGGVDITTSAYTDGQITITAITGDVVITAIAEQTSGGSTTYTNLADPSSEDWHNDYRLNSSNNLVAYAGCVTSNFIPCKEGDVLRVKGISLHAYQYARLVPSTDDKNYCAIYYPNARYPEDGAATCIKKQVTEENGVYTYKVALCGDGRTTQEYVNKTVTCIRVSGGLVNTVDDVVITINEAI